MEGVETDGWVTEMVRYVICPDEDIWYIWSDNARQRMTFNFECFVKCGNMLLFAL